MYNKYKQFLVMILITAIIFVVIIFINKKNAPSNSFDYDKFTQGQEVFNACYENVDAKREEVEEFKNEIEATSSIQDMTREIADVLPKTNCKTSFVTSDMDQIRTMAELVLSDVQDFYGTQDVKIIDSVYSTSEQYAAVYQSPRSYLFFGMTSDESSIIGIIVTPTKDGYDLERLWSREESDSLDYTQKRVQNLLYLYTEGVNK